MKIGFTYNGFHGQESFLIRPLRTEVWQYRTRDGFTAQGTIAYVSKATALRINKRVCPGKRGCLCGEAIVDIYDPQSDGTYAVFIPASRHILGIYPQGL